MTFSIRKAWKFVAIAAFIGACAHHKNDAAKSSTSATTPPAAATTTKAQDKEAKKAEKKAKKEAKKAAKAEAKAAEAKADADAKSTATGGGDMITCKSGSEERTIEIQAKDAGCETIYTKGGEAKSVA